MGHCNFYKFALDKVKDAVILLQEHKIIYVNPSFEKLSSFRLEELTSSPSIYPFIIEEQQNEFQHCLDSETDIQTELLMTNNNQTQQTYQFQFNHMNKCCTCVLVTETSYRMQTMNALSWLRSLPLQHQEHYGLLEINDQTKNYVFQGKILQEMMNRDEASLSRCTEAATNILPHAPVSRINLTIKDRDIIGSLFFVSGKNSYRSVLMYMEDITMEKSCEFEITKLKKILAGKEEMLHYINQMFEFNMPVKMGLCTLSKEGDDICYILGNHGLAEMCGTTTEGIKGKTAIQLGEKPEDISGCLRAMKKAIATDEPVQYEIYIKSPSGVEKIYWACMVPVGNEICAFFGQEFTSHKQLEMKLEEDVRKRNEELRKALDVKSQFLATMSHEMRTPLSGIMIALQLLHEAQLTCEQEALLQTATVCGELLLAVINDVLDLSKLEENRVQLEEQPFCTRAVIEDSVEIVLMDIEQKNLEIVCDVDPDVPETVIGDANRIRQILVNLLSNAVKFSFEGEIQLKVSSLPSANGSGTCDISITVLDHGIGISPEAQKHLFQPFTQADSSMTRRFGGSGLGLSISKRLAELMHGKLTFTSEEGHGSSFTCRIRVKVPGTPPSPTRKNLFDKKIVFVVDPNLNRLRIVDRMLRSLSITTMCYTSLKEGLQHLATDKFRPDLALISNNEDVNLLIPLRQFVNTIIQTGITPKYPSVPLWKVPIRESTIVKQLSKYLISDQKQQQQRPGTTSPVENPVHLLLAEDNVMNQKLITRLLKSMGYPNVDIVDNGKQAVDAVKKSKYDIILMDCMMPEMTGMEATVKIRELDPTLQPKAIIALTANAFVENRDECLKCGMDDVVTKPISQCKLKESLVKYM